MREFNLVGGQADIVTITEGSNDETITKSTLDLASKGNVTTETLWA